MRKSLEELIDTCLIIKEKFQVTGFVLRDYADGADVTFKFQKISDLHSLMILIDKFRYRLFAEDNFVCLVVDEIID